MTDSAPIIHVLLHGRALCGLPGTPSMWPKGHVWCSGEEASATATCTACLNAAKDPWRMCWFEQSDGHWFEIQIRYAAPKCRWLLMRGDTCVAQGIVETLEIAKAACRALLNLYALGDGGRFVGGVFPNEPVVLSGQEFERFEQALEDDDGPTPAMLELFEKDVEPAVVETPITETDQPDTGGDEGIRFFGKGAVAWGRTGGYAVGDRVRTLRDAGRDEWVASARTNVQWGVMGTICLVHDSHGVCYEIQHVDGTRASYDPDEIERVVAPTISCVAENGGVPDAHFVMFDDGAKLEIRNARRCRTDSEGLWVLPQLGGGERHFSTRTLHAWSQDRTVESLDAGHGESGCVIHHWVASETDPPEETATTIRSLFHVDKAKDVYRVTFTDGATLEMHNIASCAPGGDGLWISVRIMGYVSSQREFYPASHLHALAHSGDGRVVARWFSEGRRTHLLDAPCTPDPPEGWSPDGNGGLVGPRQHETEALDFIEISEDGSEITVTQGDEYASAPTAALRWVLAEATKEGP